jgi:NTE family protein
VIIDLLMDIWILKYKDMRWIGLFALLISSSVTFGQLKNLVLEGGGVRGIAYVGAIKALEEYSQMDEIENVAGTSAGAITASLIAVGYNAAELEEILSNLNLRKFNDGKAIFIGGTNRILKRYGWYQGEKMTEWVDDLMEEKTGIDNLTLSQLYLLGQDDSKYKNLFVTATNLTQQNWQILSYKSHPNLRIADAVRISSSIPMYFTAVFMDADGNVYEQPQQDIPTDVMADGGFISNYPLQIFDSTYAIPQTLGVQLDRKAQIDSDSASTLAPYPIENIQDYIGAFYNLVLENLNRTELTDEDWKRTISINNCGISQRVRKMPKEEVDQLIQAGYEATKDWLKLSSFSK